MTVAELIVELNKMPPAMKVLVGVNGSGMVWDSVRLKQIVVRSNWGLEGFWSYAGLPHEDSCYNGQDYARVVNIQV